MVKKILSPFQQILLKRGLCVGCTAPLNKAEKRYSMSSTKSLVQCKCTRRYIYDSESGKFRRATFEEEAQYLKSRNKKAVA